MKYFLRITQFLNGLLLVRFSISKLFAWPISVNAFIEMARPLGIDPTLFRVSTGILISIVCLSYFAGFYLIITNKIQEAARYLLFAIFSNLLGIGAMVGALIAEFTLREAPKWPLVYIASFIVITSIFNFLYLRKVELK